MSVITIFSGIFCNEEAVTADIVESTGHRLITDDIIIQTASELSQINQNGINPDPIKPEKVKQAFSSKTSVFNKFTHEKERSLAYIKLAVAQAISNENIMISGYSGLLVPHTISHVLKVCLIANNSFRLEMAERTRQLSREEASQKISDEDHDKSIWARRLFGSKDPWDAMLYDMVLPMGKTDASKASSLIKENLLKKAVEKSADSKKAVANFLLEAQTEIALVDAGHNVKVSAKDGEIVLTINKQVLMLARLEEELKEIAQTVSGVVSVQTIVLSEDEQPHVYKKHNVEMPSKVLLVDDEREFVQTLSERLQLRDMGCVVAYDGASALELVRNDAPEVMIIDLKMPEIDGMQILKEVKEFDSRIEVIVLTGHGSDEDKQMCMDLGAFGYMQKPVDINFLSQTLKEAHEKVKTHETT